MSLQTRLQMLVASPAIMGLAQHVPLYLVGLFSGAAIAAGVHDAASASAGLLAAASSLGSGVASAMLYDLVKPETDDETRAEQIAAGLAARDPQMVRLVAEALTQAGPDLAAALPDHTHQTLIAALQQGMTQSGGALAAIAPAYTAALQLPPTDWTALQAQLRQTAAQVTQRMEADGGTIARSKQKAPATGGPIEQTMVARNGGSITDSEQRTGADSD